MYRLALEGLARGGGERMAVTVEPVAFLGMALAARAGGGELCREAQVLVLGAGEALLDAGRSRQGIRVLLRGAVSASRAGAAPDLVYSMLREALVGLEDRCPLQAAKRSAVAEVAGAVCECGGLEPGQRATLGEVLLGYAGGMLSSADEAGVALAAAHVRWCGAERDEEWVGRCVDRALRAAAACERRLAAAGRAGGAEPALVRCRVARAVARLAAEGSAAAGERAGALAVALREAAAGGDEGLRAACEEAAALLG